MAFSCERTVMSERPVIVWFRRDLRLHDQPALTWASSQPSRIVPLFVVDPASSAARSRSPNRTWFLLGVRARRCGGPWRTSDRRSSFGSAIRGWSCPDLAVAIGAPDGRRLARLRAVWPGAGPRRRGRALAARDVGLARPRAATWSTSRKRSEPRPGARSACTHRSGGPGTDSSDGRSSPRRPGSAWLPFRASTPGTIPSLADLGLGERPTGRPGRVARTRRDRPPGRGCERWLDHGIDAYAATRDRLDLDDGTSRLSADLHLGLLSPLEVVERADGPGEGRRIFRQELVWRDFYAHVLFHEPAVRRRAFRPAFDAIAWSTDPARLEAWRIGPDRLSGHRCGDAPAGAPRAGCPTEPGCSWRRS